MRPSTHPAAAVPTPDVETTERYLSLRALATYAGLSIRTLRNHLVHASYPMPHYRVGGKILVKRSEFDAWMRAFRSEDAAGQCELVTTLLRSL